MSAMVDLIMPKLGESIMEATILKWLKQPGDTILQDEAVLEIATDKVDSEVPSTASGVLAEVLFRENDVVPIGAVIARIRTGGAAAAETGAAAAPVDLKAVETPSLSVPFVPAEPAETVRPLTPASAASSASGRFYSPLVLKIAREEGIGMAELESLPGTGSDGRVSKTDILAYVQHRSGSVSARQPQVEPIRPASGPVAEPVHTAVAAAPLVSVVSGNVEIVEMDRMRKMIARHMTESRQTSAHVTSFVECDVTNLVIWRERVKHEFEQREGTKITYTPLFMEAVTKCLKKFTWLNSSVEGDSIIIKKDINLGMATALPNGNLIVPVIKNADQLNLVGLARQVNGLADAARKGKLKPDDTAGGTFTITNVGTFGSIMGTPIINQPQVAIMAVGAIKKRPMVIETEMGDSIAIRHMMYISLSYDHRIIDGAMGSSFLNAVSKELEAFDIKRTA